MILRPRLDLLVIPLLALSLSMVVGCKKDGSGDGSAAAANLPVKGPWDAVKITFASKGPSGPVFVAENTGSKTVKVLFMDFYAYDAKGTQLGKKELSYNLPLKGGAKDTSVSPSDIPGAATWEATYHGIEFEGDGKPTMDYKRAPDKKAKGK